MNLAPFPINFPPKKGISPENDGTLYQNFAKRLLASLQWIQLQPNNILIMGETMDFLAQSLKAQYPHAHLIRGHLHPGTHPAIARPPQSVDLICANMLFQWSTDLPALSKACFQLLKPGGFLLFNTLGPDTLKELKIAFSSVDQHRHINDFADLHDWGDALQQAGFFEPVMVRNDVLITYSNLDSLLNELKGLGSRNTHPNKKKGLMTPRAFQKLKQAYATLALDTKRLGVTVEIVTGQGWRSETPQKKSAKGQETFTFSVETFKENL